MSLDRDFYNVKRETNRERNRQQKKQNKNKRKQNAGCNQAVMPGSYLESVVFSEKVIN